MLYETVLFGAVPSPSDAEYTPSGAIAEVSAVPRAAFSTTVMTTELFVSNIGALSFRSFSVTCTVRVSSPWLPSLTSTSTV